jgi:hypothetical protein
VVADIQRAAGDSLVLAAALVDEAHVATSPVAKASRRHRARAESPRGDSRVPAGQIVQLDPLCFGEGHGPFDDSLELANVAGHTRIR